MKNHSLASKTKEAIYRHPLLFLTCICICIASACCYIYITPAVYESQAVIENPNSNKSTEIALVATGESAITAKITSPVFIAAALEGRVTPISCYVEQDLQKKYSAYTFPYEVNFRILGEKFSAQEYAIKEIDDTQFMLMSDVHGITRSKTGKYDEELIDQDLAITVNRKKHQPFIGEEIYFPAEFSFRIESFQTMAENLAGKNGTINATDKNGVITISCKSDNPIKAQAISSALASSITSGTNTTSEISRQNESPFENQLATLAKQLEVTEAEIAAYKNENHITDLNFETAKSLDILKNLELQKTQLKLEKAALDNTSKYLRKNRGENNSNVDYGAISDPVFSQQLALLNEKYENKTNGTAGTQVDQEIESVKNLISERILNTRKKNAIQLHKLNNEISAVQTELSTLPEKANILNSLNRKLDLDKKVYDLLVEKRAIAMLTPLGSQGGMSIIKPANMSLAPVWPNNWVILMIGLLTGIFASFPICIMAETMKQQKISTREALDRQTKIPFIGSISSFSTNTKGTNESISQLCTRVLLQPNIKIITFASTDKGAGKTFISTRFAQAFAAMDKKVLVLDMNHIEPAVSGYFNVSPERSLADVIDGKCDIHEAINITSFPNLDVLECGNMPSGVNSLLASNRRISIFDELKKHYDVIVTDTTDIGTQIDAIPMMKLGDLSLFVVRANTTRKQSLVAAEQIKRDYDIQNLHFLLNSVTKSAGESTARRSRIRNINDSTGERKPAYVPQMLRKISLWFY